VLDRLAEGQEELRAELGILAERFDALEHRVGALTSDHATGRADLARSHTSLVESFTAGRRRDRMLTYGIATALVLSLAALVAIFSGA
jgi:hypothetical protein